MPMSGRDFNPRARVGRDWRHLFGSAVRKYFNPRARVGRDNHGAPTHADGVHFNPRARVGRDHVCVSWLNAEG